MTSYYLGAVFPAGRGNGRVEVAEAGMLRIKKFLESDNGEYICRVTNSAGQAEKLVSLEACNKK